MLTLIKKDISSLFTVFKTRLKRGTTDTRPGQLKDLLLRRSLFHKPLQEPALSDTSPISIIHYRGTDSGAYMCVYECESGGNAVYAADAAPFHFSSFPAPSAYLSHWRMRSREEPLISASLFYVHTVQKNPSVSHRQIFNFLSVINRCIRIWMWLKVAQKNSHWDWWIHQCGRQNASAIWWKQFFRLGRRKWN